MPYSKAKAKAYGKGPRAVIWPPYSPDVQEAQSSGKGQGTTTDPVSHVNLMIAHWEAFANRLLRKFTRKYMFKVLRIERRRRAAIMRENTARRTLIHANPQYGPFRPIDIYEDSQSDEEPTVSVAPAASDVSTAARGPGFQPPLRLDRALDVLNSPGSTRQKNSSPLQFQELRSWRFGRSESRTLGGTQTRQCRS